MSESVQVEEYIQDKLDMIGLRSFYRKGSMHLDVHTFVEVPNKKKGCNDFYEITWEFVDFELRGGLFPIFDFTIRSCKDESVVKTTRDIHEVISFLAKLAGK